MSQDKIRIVIADDHRLFTEGLHLILKREERMEVVGDAENGIRAVDMVNRYKPDILLLDIAMPKMDGIEVLPIVREKSPGTRPLMLTASRDEEDVINALKGGARGYLTKTAGSRDLIKAIKAVHGGEMWLDRKLITRFFEKEFYNDSGQNGNLFANAKTLLTKREQEVLSHLIKGITNKEIAAAMFISEKTVKTHLNSIFKKLKVTCRLQALVRAFKDGLC